MSVATGCESTELKRHVSSDTMSWCIMYIQLFIQTLSTVDNIFFIHVSFSHHLKAYTYSTVNSKMSDIGLTNGSLIQFGKQGFMQEMRSIANAPGTP